MGKSVNCGFRLGPARDQGVDLDSSGSVSRFWSGSSENEGWTNAQRVKDDSRMRGEEKAADSR